MKTILARLFSAINLHENLTDEVTVFFDLNLSLSAVLHLQAAKNAWAYTFMKYMRSNQISEKMISKMCKPDWLVVTPMSDRGRKDPTLLAAQNMSTCPADLSVMHFLRKGMANFLSVQLLMQAFAGTDYTDSLIKPLPDAASPLPPCEWETVEITGANPSLYKLTDAKDHDVRIKVEFESEVGTYEDKVSFETVTLITNVFGLVGVYLGYSVMQLYAIAESVGIRLWNKYMELRWTKQRKSANKRRTQ